MRQTAHAAALVGLLVVLGLSGGLWFVLDLVADAANSMPDHR
jgi:hypothetical protein